MQEVNQSANTGKAKNPTVLIIILLVVVVLVLGAVIAYPKVKDSMDKKKSEKETVYHAVFLTNGQVYFGKMDDAKSKYVNLSQVYYLQLNQQQTQQVQPAEGDTQTKEGEEGGQAAATTETEQPEFTLVKLGQELHGPEDEMVINQEQVLFYEKLKSDSNVVKAIKENKEKEESGK
ncbi:hypothetical protein KJ903_00225 [Patescibacteria group bacterium]|nr:hypothetical protein [Patescibacteria group bacterium]